MAAEKAKHLKGNQVCDEFAVKHTYISMHNALCVNFKKNENALYHRILRVTYVLLIGRAPLIFIFFFVLVRAGQVVRGKNQEQP